MNTDPLVSIICLTYNEEKYVRDCLDGFVMQKTSFPFDVYIYDDASTDATQSIILEYVERFPDIFKPTFYEENQYSKGERFIGLREGFNTANGKFIAYCEGDDYWTDPFKLQKQVDFLETNPEYSVCAHETVIRNDTDPKEDGTLFTHTKVNLFLDRTTRNRYSLSDTLTGNIFHISSMVFRKMHFDWPEWIKEITALDMVIFMMLACNGDIYLMRDQMSVYRHNSTSITSTQNMFASQIAFNDASISILDKMDVFWQRSYHHDIAKVKAGYYTNNMFRYLSKGNRNYHKAMEMAQKAIKSDIFSFAKSFIIESAFKIKQHLA